MKIHGVSKKDPTTGQLLTYVNATCKIEGRIRSEAAVTVRLSDGRVLTSQTNQVPPDVKAVLKLAETDKGLDHALTVYGKEEHDWPGLYNVLNAVVQAFGAERKLIEQGFVTRSEIDEFKARSERHRHGFSEHKQRAGKRKISADPGKQMTLLEAKVWIENILNDWVKKATQGEVD